MEHSTKKAELLQVEAPPTGHSSSSLREFADVGKLDCTGVLGELGTRTVTTWSLNAYVAPKCRAEAFVRRRG